LPDATSLASLWRVFPYDPTAPSGAPFAADMVPNGQGSGRFDVPGQTPVWYLAESDTHAVAEAIQSLRGQALADADLLRAGRRLAVVSVRVAPDVLSRIVDLCDPTELARRGIGPDRLASRQTMVTQRIARRLAEEAVPGFRWWSSLDGDWHATVLFHARLLRSTLGFGVPEPLTLDSPALVAACRTLGIRRAAVRR
jgi:hypothetical protein